VILNAFRRSTDVLEHYINWLNTDGEGEKKKRLDTAGANPEFFDGRGRRG
jgi:hypothetical protein